MIRTIFNVVRGEGVRSALRRAHERLTERNSFASDGPILNVTEHLAPRTGGVATQLMWRLHEEAKSRSVAVATYDALATTRAKLVHIEGTHALPIDAVMRLIASGTKVIVSVHDFTAREHRELLSATA